ncbi:MAG: hypothetical protein JSR60_13055 [Proteobacteria bacterium]|nr:hypothetical protein [Pseudomonadota bacterium]
MYILAVVGINVLILIVLFAVYSKLDELSRAVQALQPAQAELPAPDESAS